jgi:redox-sensitive bicupin YhaK (pirin superfamily)
VASPDGADGSVTIHADASIRSGLLDGDERIELPLHPGRLTYVHLARGTLQANGHALTAGDALTLSGEDAAVAGQRPRRRAAGLRPGAVARADTFVRRAVRSVATFPQPFEGARS